MNLTHPSLLPQVHLDQTRKELKHLEEVALEYHTHAAALSSALQTERKVLIHGIMSFFASSTEGVAKARRDVITKMSAFAAFHYSLSPKRYKQDVLQLSPEATAPERHLDVFTAALKPDELERIRMYTQEFRHTGDHHAVEVVSHAYDGIIRDLSVLTARNTVSTASSFAKAQFGIMGYLSLVTSLAQVQMSRVWLKEVVDQPSYQEAVDAFSASSAKLMLSQALFDSYASDTMLSDLTLLLKKAPYLKELSLSFSHVQTMYHPTTSVAGNSSTFMCESIKEWGYANLSQLNVKQESLNAERKEEQREQFGIVITVIVICFFGVVLHICSIKSYYNMMNLLLQAKREIEKLMKSLERMQAFSNLSFEEHDEESEIAHSKKKGIPAAEKALFLIGGKIKHIKGFLPKSVFCRRFKEEDVGLEASQRKPGTIAPFTELKLIPVKNVTILTVSISFLNAVSPQEEVPVKQKALEKATGTTLATILAAAEERSGYVTDVTADYCTMCFNLLQVVSRAAADAAAAAIEILEKLQSSGVHSSAGICTGDVLAGNVGVPTLKGFVVLGSAMANCRMIEKISGYYNQGTLVDGATHELISSDNTFQCLPLDVISQEAGAPDSEPQNIALYKLSLKNMSEDQEKVQHWGRMFSHYHDGNALLAKEESLKYAEKYGESLLTKRFDALCDAYPNIPPRNIYELLQRKFP